MHPLATPDFTAATHQSHRMAVRVEVWEDNTKSYTFDQITDGNVRYDDAEYRTQIDVTATDEDGTLIPKDTFSNLLEPGRTYLKAYRGLYLPGQEQPILIPMGGATINEVRVDESGGSRTVMVDARDWATKTALDTLSSTFVVPTFTFVKTTLEALLGESLEPWQTFLFNGDDTLPSAARVFQEGEDRWTHGRDLARSIGCDLYYNEDLNLVCEPIPDVADPVDEFVEGTKCKLLYGSKIRSIESVFNSVKVIGDNPNTSNVFSGVAEDRNPQSPTSIERIGRRAHRTTEGTPTSNAQCEIIAQMLLKRMSGRPERMELTSLVNSGLRLFDTVRVQREALQANGLRVIDKLTIPLVATRGLNSSMRERVIEV